MHQSFDKLMVLVEQLESALGDLSADHSARATLATIKEQVSMLCDNTDTLDGVVARELIIRAEGGDEGAEMALRGALEFLQLYVTLVQGGDRYVLSSGVDESVDCDLNGQLLSFTITVAPRPPLLIVGGSATRR